MIQPNQMSQPNQMNQEISQENENKDKMILFYHENSKACQKLKTHLPKNKHIQIINIDQLVTIPPSITSVPTLVINNNKILKGKEVFDYFTKSDDMDYINLCGKNNSECVYSLLDDENNIQSNSAYSSIDNMEYCGVPDWNENEETNKNNMDIENYQKQRDEAIKGIQPSQSPSS